MGNGTLMPLWREMQELLSMTYVGQMVRVTDAATSYSSDLEQCEGIVTEVQVDSFGAEGEGQAMFYFEGHTQRQPRCVMINVHCTRIELL